ncbi:MAG: OmpA family protein [Chitinophagaceae bacterium]
MYKPLLLLVASSCALLSYGQKTDTLLLFYKPDQFTISKPDQQKLDGFLLRGWDRIAINGHTDETDAEEYNLDLSRKRSSEVYEYFMAKNIPGGVLSSQYFGESMPRANNNSDDGRALNRRTEIIGYQFPKVKLKPKTDPMIPVTKTLDNGFIITYRPGSMPADMADNFGAGFGMNFQLISNTMEMRQNNLFNNTTNGEILSSVLIICGNRLNPCKLDSPVLVRVPIPFNTNCPIEKVKFFSSVAENGKRIWQEQTKLFYPEIIGGRKYIRIWLDNFCECINFDFKIDPECYDIDSTKVQYVNADIKNLSAELKGLNCVYIPRKIDDTNYKILFLKDKLNGAAITFALYKGKRRIRSFRDQPLTAFPYDETAKRYVLSTGTIQLYFPKLKVDNVVLKVNGDKYRIAPENNKYEFVYLNRQTEDIMVDFTIYDSKGRVSQYKNQPLGYFPVDESTGYRVIDKKFLKALKQTGNIAQR